VSTQQTDQPVDLLALDQQLCFGLAVASRTVISVYRPLLEPMGLTHPQYLVMLALWGRAPLSVSELSRLLDLDAGTLSRLLKRLEASGLVHRARSTADERTLAVSLTEQGHELRQQALRVPETIIEQMGVPLDELLDLHRRLGELTAAAKVALEKVAASG
jgi:MarR family transcriptional regulator, organic hydroperoxide resistance regulator